MQDLNDLHALLNGQNFSVFIYLSWEVPFLFGYIYFGEIIYKHDFFIQV